MLAKAGAPQSVWDEVCLFVEKGKETMKRRQFGKSIFSAAVASSALFAQRSAAQDSDPFKIALRGNQPGKPIEVGMLLYPGLTLLDLIGPHTVLAPHSKIHLIWKTPDLIASDSRIAVQPTTTIKDCPADLDVLFVPGGLHMAALNEPDVLSFLADRGARAKFVTSVCSGSIVLGAAGLLRGYKATSHWAVRDLLPLFGAEPVEARVVTDRNRITGGGVTAGIDFGLVLLAKMRGDEAAKLSQLAMEYDPQPPFDSGSPKKAGPALTQQLLHALEPLHAATQQFAMQQRQRTGA
jgi:cyclohexyl-isocyanide hydratase